MYFPISLLLSHFTDNNLIQLPTMLAKEFVYLRYTVPCVFTHSQFCYYFKSRHQQAGRNHKICQHCLCTTLDSQRVIFSKNPLIEFSSPFLLLGLQKSYPAWCPTYFVLVRQNVRLNVGTQEDFLFIFWRINFLAGKRTQGKLLQKCLEQKVGNIF